MTRRPHLSVVLCTHNPAPAVLDEVLAALAGQFRPGAHELVIVDNASDSPLDLALPPPLDQAAQQVREPMIGLTNARAAGVRAAQAPLLVFVDDDNVLAADYLANAEAIAAERGELGVFAGRAFGRFAAPPSWLHRPYLACYAVRDLGDQPIEGPGGALAAWEPFGAGMGVRADIAAAFADLNARFEAGAPLGRRADAVLSGEDSLFTLIARRMGYRVAYRPELRLEHVISRRRMSAGYLCKLLEAQGRAEALLRGAQGDLAPAAKPAPFAAFLARRFLSRLRHPGLHEALTHLYWDVGYFEERARLSEPPARALAEALDAIGGDARDGL